MKPPSIAAYIFGNIVSFTAVLLMELYIGFQAITGLSSGWLALVGLAFAAYSAACNRRVTSYAAWKREWNGMNGNGQAGGKRPSGWVRYAVGMPTWCCAAVLFLSNRDASLNWAADVFWLVSAAGFANLIWPLLRAKLRFLQREPVVAICLGLPILPVLAQDDSSHLPEYCKQLILQQ